MRPYLIVVSDPTLRQHLCFQHRVKEFAIQEFCSHTSIKAFDVSVLPWTTWLNIDSDGTRVFQPLADLLGGEFTSVIASHILRNTADQHEVR
ncbi:hypothetical protein SDC9_137624 [bioreactor metagenome]|uniref:Uncharacterized protein n=1 Tax=bioreactor metagenome TaxID=1076179 RepID=A0A645DP01_9ZZZZ